MPKLPRSAYGAIDKEQLLAWLQQMSKNLDSLISFGKTNQNSTFTAPDHSDLNIWKATGVTPGVANTEFAISHNLLWIPWHYHYFLDVAGQLYQAPTTGTHWTAATNSTLGNIYLKCTVASANYVVIIM